MMMKIAFLCVISSLIWNFAELQKKFEYDPTQLNEVLIKTGCSINNTYAVQEAAVNCLYANDTMYVKKVIPVMANQCRSLLAPGVEPRSDSAIALCETLDGSQETIQLIKCIVEVIGYAPDLNNSMVNISELTQ